MLKDRSKKREFGIWYYVFRLQLRQLFIEHFLMLIDRGEQFLLSSSILGHFLFDVQKPGFSNGLMLWCRTKVTLSTPRS